MDATTAEPTKQSNQWLGVLLLTMSLSLGHAVVWIIGAARGRLAARGGLSIRLVPWLAVMSVVVTLAAMLVLRAGGLDMVGTASWPNLTLCGATLIMPALGVATLWHAWRGSPAAPRAVRALAWASGIVVTGLALFLAGYGWIGVKLWAAG